MASRPEPGQPGQPSIKGYSQALRMAALTCSLIGLQFTWSVEMTYFTPYLLKLGLEKSQTALVWLAPPLSGFIVQPVIGTISDSATWRWGRRRPYMLVASLLVAICLLIIGWAPELVRLFITNEAQAKTMTIVLVVFCIYALDFAINVVQATSRGLIVDTLPTTQQQTGSAWAGRMLGFGHLLGFFIGTLNLVKIFGTFLGESQLKQVCIIASCLLLSTVAVTCLCVQERVMLNPESSQNSWFRVIRVIYKVAMNLPKKIQAICWITFWCWIGWSPFHVYVTTWVGETYYQQNDRVGEELRNSTDVVGAISRKGAVSLFLFSVVALVGSILWPWLVKSPQEGEDTQPIQQVPKNDHAEASRIWDVRPDLVTAWAISQTFFSASMILAPFSRSYAFAVAIVALCGIPWAMYGWAPLALLGEEINKLEGEKRDQTYSRLRQEEVTEMHQSTTEEEPLTQTTQVEEVDGKILDDSGEAAGVYLGIWNMFATIPQFLATLIAMVAFAIFEPGKSLASGEDGTEVPHKTSGIAFCLAVGAVSSLVAAILTFRLRKL